MTYTITTNRFKRLWMMILILLVIGGVTPPAHAQIVSTSTLTASDGMSNAQFGWAVSVNGSYMAVAAPYQSIGSNAGQGAVTLYSYSDSAWSRMAEITAADGAANDYFGISVCLSGNTLAVGAPYRTVNGNLYQGAVYLFTRSGTTWTQTAELTASDGAAYDNFGYSVSLNGSNLAVGATYHAVGSNSGQGAVYLFAHSGSNWPQKSEITSADGAQNDNFGWSVSLGSTTLAVGAISRTVNGNVAQGTVYVYTHSGTNWNQQAELTSSDGGKLDFFGFSICLSGAILIVGAPRHSPSSSLTDQGSVYVYIRSGTTWNQQAEVMAADGAAYDEFGQSVSFSGTTLAVGAPFRTVAGNSSQGTIYTFLHSGPNWTLQQELTESVGAAEDAFGYSVSLNGSALAVGAPGETVNGNSFQGDTTVYVTGNAALTGAGGAANDAMGNSVSIYGTLMAVGAPYKKIGSNSYVGAVYIYTHSGSTWTQQAELTPPDDATNDEFGTSVSLNGNTLVVGAADKLINGNALAGAVYIYTLSGTTWSLQAEFTSSDVAEGDFFGYTVSLNASTLAVGAPFKTIGSNALQGAVYIFTRSGSTWTQKTRLTASDGAAYDEFGFSVSLTSTSLAVGAPVHQVGSNLYQGAAYIFTRSNNIWSQTAEVAAGDGGYGDYFGNSIGMLSTSGGTMLVVGAPNHVPAASDNAQGTVFSYFSPTGSTRWIQTDEVSASDGATGDHYGFALSLNGSRLIVGTPLKSINGTLEQGAAYLYTMVNSGVETRWNLLSELTAADGGKEDEFGLSVCVSGTNLAIGAPYHKVKNNSEQGVVYTLP